MKKYKHRVSRRKTRANKKINRRKAAYSVSRRRRHRHRHRSHSRPRRPRPRRRSRRRKQRGGLSWPFGPELKNLGASIPYTTKSLFQKISPSPPSAPANPAQRTVNPQPYKGQFARQTAHSYDMPDIPKFWEISNAATKSI